VEASKDSKLRRVERWYKSAKDRCIICEIAYRDLVRKVSKIWQQKSGGREVRYSDGDVNHVGPQERVEYRWQKLSGSRSEEHRDIDVQIRKHARYDTPIEVAGS
jgi:hypothetical protein